MDRWAEYRKQAAAELQRESMDRAEKVRSLRAEIAALEGQSSDAIMRLTRVNATLHDQYACPRCWIWDGRVVRMTPVANDTDADLMQCKQCNSEFELQA